MRRKLFPLLFLILIGCAGCEAIVIGLAVGGGIAAGGWLFDKAVSHHSSTAQPAPALTPTQLSRFDENAPVDARVIMLSPEHIQLN